MDAPNKTANKDKTDTTSQPQIDPATQLQEIQKLLFGQQIAQLESAMHDMHKTLQQQLQSLDKSLSARLEKQTTHFNHQLNELAQHVDALHEQQQNRTALTEDEVSALQQSLSQLEAQTAAAHNELEQQMCSEQEKLHSLMTRQHESVMEGVQGNTDTLQQNKVDRQLLADLFTQVAQSIRA